MGRLSCLFGLSLTSSTIGSASTEDIVTNVAGGVLVSFSDAYTRRVFGCCKRCRVPRIEDAEGGRSADPARDKQLIYLSKKKTLSCKSSQCLIGLFSVSHMLFYITRAI
jgi:hypothetical protein